MKINRPIITNLLDDDFYKFTMAAVVFQNFSYVDVSYEFFNRGGTQFPDGFADELNYQIQLLSLLSFTNSDIEYLKGLSVFKRNFIEFLRGFKMNPDEVVVLQDGGKLRIVIKGPWYRTIFWEVKLMAIISELYFELTGISLASDWFHRIELKDEHLESAGCKWADFGTRRRRSFMVQYRVVSIMRNSKGFLGTSNIFLARELGVKPIGTSAHEAVMAMAVFVGYENANVVWLNYWSDYYNGELGIALPDTFTTNVFLKTFDGKLARLWDGLRQDSGDPYKWMEEKIIPHYKRLGIPTRDKKIVFSDNLNVEKGIALHNEYNGLFTVSLGIGTNFTNDTFTDEQKAKGIKALNMVIKITSADFGKGKKNTVKLSDDVGKNTGDWKEVAAAQSYLGI